MSIILDITKMFFDGSIPALLEGIKIAAGKRDVPFQSLIKIWLAEKIDPFSTTLADS